MRRRARRNPSSRRCAVLRVHRSRGSLSLTLDQHPDCEAVPGFPAELRFYENTPTRGKTMVSFVVSNERGEAELAYGRLTPEGDIVWERRRAKRASVLEQYGTLADSLTDLARQNLADGHYDVELS